MTKQNDEKKKTAVKPIKKENKKTPKKVEVKEEKKEIKKESNTKSLIELLIIIAAIVVILVFFQGTMIWNIVVLLLILSVLIFVHEFGHYITGKMCGVYIYEFALGMGPKVLGFRRKNDPTEYTLRALPIGGFCQLAGEEGEDDEKLPKDKFMCNKSKLQRAIILIAGVTMNFITALVLLFMISFIWGSTEQSSIVGSIEPNSPAEIAGLKVGDKIVECNGYKISSWDKLTIVTNLKNKKNTFKYVVESSDGKKTTYTLKPAKYVVVDGEHIKITKENTKEDILKEHNIKKSDAQVVSLIGIGAPTENKKGFVNAIKYAFKKFGSIVETMLLIIGSLITGKLGLDALSGPVGMYQVVETVSAYGMANIVYLMAYLSINLGVINILPFPAFDGGRVVFIGIEAITGKKINPNIEALIHNIGFFLILGLMLYITFQDIGRLF